MNRIKDYTGFAGWFAGLGYIVLWPLTVDNLSDKPFGASIFCRDGPISVPDLLCNASHPLRMPGALHALGFLSAVFVTVRLLVCAFKGSCRAIRSRQTALPANIPAEVPPPPRKPAVPYRYVKPRTHFGLRGIAQPAQVFEKDNA